MSEENVEIVRSLFEAWNAGDIDALREMHGPDMILQTVEDWPELGPYVGREAFMHFVEQLRGTWDADAVEATGIIEAGDRVVVRFIWHGVGNGSRGEYGVHGRGYDSGGQNPRSGVLLESRRGPRSRRA